MKTSRNLVKGLLRPFLVGAAFGLGVAFIAVSIMGIEAATLPLFTGPAGTNPALRPDLLGDLNTLVNQINSNAAFADTGTPSAAIGVMPVSTTSIAAGGAVSAPTVIQIMAPVFTTSTGSIGTFKCATSLAAGCFLILDNNGTARWVPFN